MLSSIRYSSLNIYDEHSPPLSKEPICYIIPNVTIEAHRNSKKVGAILADETAKLIMSEYQNLLSQSKYQNLLSQMI